MDSKVIVLFAQDKEMRWQSLQSLQRNVFSLLHVPIIIIF